MRPCCSCIRAGEADCQATVRPVLWTDTLAMPSVGQSVQSEGFMPAVGTRKPRVTLVRGPFVSSLRAASNEATPVIGLAYIAGYLKGHSGYDDVTIADAVGEDLNGYWSAPEYPGVIIKGLHSDDIISRIPADTDVIGFSAMFSAEWPIQRALITATRARFPHALFVAGGEHITALAEYSLKDCPALDVCVRGEGEHPFYEVVESWHERRDYSQVSGITYRNSAGEFVQNGPL